MSKIEIKTSGTLISHDGFSYIYVETKIEVNNRVLDSHLKGEYNKRVDSWSKKGISAKKTFRELTLSKRTAERAMPLTHQDAQRLLSDARQIANELIEIGRKVAIPRFDYKEFERKVKESIRIEETIEI